MGIPQKNYNYGNTFVLLRFFNLQDIHKTKVESSINDSSCDFEKYDRTHHVVIIKKGE